MAMSGKRDRRVTPRQMQILRFIRDHEQEHGYAPTMQELADELGISKVTVFEHLEHLRRKGLVKRRRHEARSMALTERVMLPQRQAGSLPLAGVIAAGEPIDAISQPQTIDADEFFAGRSERFVLQVRGDSMIDEQIRDGDYVVVEPRSSIRNGQTVVALLDDGEATLKKFYRQGRRVRLRAANPAYKPIVVPADQVQVQGIVVGVLRKY